MKTFDVVVLGGGTAGTAAARAAREAGASTVMFNDGELGGLCILRGCMPTKTMLHAAHLVHHAAHHATPGIGRSELSRDFGAIMANKDAKVSRFRDAKLRAIEAGGYEVIDARARFVGRDTVEAGGETYRFERGAIIATGSVTDVPPIPGLDGVPFLTSDDVMGLQVCPASLIIVGSGPIGLEFAQFFTRIGAEVHLVSRRRVFEKIDPLLADEMERVMAAEPRFHALNGAVPVRVESVADGVRLEYARGGERGAVVAESLLLATGRQANLAGLGLDAAGVEVDGRRVVCDEHMRTTNPAVFVAGDASGHRLLLHVANWEGRVAGLGAAGAPGEHRVEQRLHVEVVFTDPALATVGMTEAAARAAGHDVRTAVAKFPETGRAITMDVTHGVIKLVADRHTKEILGAQILGPRADDVVHTVAAVMYYRGTAEDMLRMPWYHPTLSEVLLELARGI